MALEGLLNNPLFGLGIGLLQGAAPGGTFGGGAQQGLLNMMNMQQAGTQNQLQQAQLNAIQQQQQRRKQLAERYAQTQPTMTPYEEGTWGEGFQQVTPPTATPEQFQSLLMQDVLQTDPSKVYESMIPKTDQTDKMRNYEYLVGQGVPKDVALQRVFTGGVNVNVGGDKLVTPSDAEKIRLPSGEPVPPGTRYADLPGMGAKFFYEKTPEQASKISMAKTAISQFPSIEKLMFTKEGDPNWKNITNAQIRTWGTKGRDLAGMYEFGIQAITRGETGAAMPPEEVKNTRLRFQPVIGDSKELVKVKWEMYKDFLNGSLKLIDTSLGTPKLDEVAFNAELNKRLTEKKPDNGWSIELIQ